MRCVTVFALFALSCATLANEGEGDRDLPSAGMGPFRKLASEEQRGTPPVVLDVEQLQLRDPDVLRVQGDPKNTEIHLYFTATMPTVTAITHDAIFRSHAMDARTFYGTSTHAGVQGPRQVLAASQAWEGGGVRAPSMLRASDGEIWMYYASDGGIGLARSKDGLAFTSQAAPVLALADANAPSVVRLADGSFRMLYDRGGQIWEADSANGTSFTTRGVVLGPSGAAAILDPGEKPPFDQLAVKDPCVTTRITASGRLHFRVLYTGVGLEGSAVGFAARYGTEGPLSRNRVPVFSSVNNDRSPGLFEWTDPAARTQAISMLYDTQTKTVGGTSYPIIAAAVAPVSVKLTMPGEFPDSP